MDAKQKKSRRGSSAPASEPVLRLLRQLIDVVASPLGVVVKARPNVLEVRAIKDRVPGLKLETIRRSHRRCSPHRSSKARPSERRRR